MHLDGTTHEELAIKQDATLLNDDKPKQAEPANYDYSKTSEELKKLRQENIQLRQDNVELQVRMLLLPLEQHLNYFF